MRTLIRGGLVLDPANRVQSVLNVLMENGKIAAVTEAEPEADEVVEAAGRVVAPGFIDIHMHEDPLNEDGTLYRDEEKAIFNCMLRMGVTTAIGGQCGLNVHTPSEYLRRHRPRRRGGERRECSQGTPSCANRRDTAINTAARQRTRCAR